MNHLGSKFILALSIISFKYGHFRIPDLDAAPQVGAKMLVLHIEKVSC